MSEGIECPYCGCGQEINHDDGYGYEEDTYHQQECHNCEKIFSFTTSIVLHYEASKCDCQNGGDHKWKPTITVPRQYTQMICAMCDERRPCTEGELKEVIESRKKYLTKEKE